MTNTRQLRCVMGIALLALPPAILHAQDMPLMVFGGPKAADPNVKVPAWDVVSVKEHKSGENMMRYQYTAAGIKTTNLSLKSLIQMAYGMRPDLISGGPGWMSTTGFDVEAKVADEDAAVFAKLGPRQRQVMIEAMLADRFKLKVHRETKEGATYDLVIAKSGPRLKEAEGTEPHWNMGGGRFKLEDATAQMIADQLANAVQHNVADKTGLRGTYDVELKWTPDESKSGEDAPPPIFTAVQEQLGLRLQPARGPVEWLVIDHVEKPAEN